ncbi:MAG: hypothetical protein PHF14_01405 [Verrucomicrobiota bacterium]|jgi:hypothetical protein|nr:hypothetical protein [Verrucomicrobiota bacterium]MDD8045101.1 hypothetical protein [Verrucomicrobiota bacterium]
MQNRVQAIFESLPTLTWVLAGAVWLAWAPACPAVTKAKEQVQKIVIQYPPQFQDLVKLKEIQRLDRPLLLHQALEQFDIRNSDLGRLLVTGDLELIVGGGVQAPPEHTAAQVMLLEALGMAPDRPEVLATVAEWHLWELEKPQITNDSLYFHTDLYERWTTLEPDNSAPRIGRAFLYWRMGNRMAAIKECQAALECPVFDNHSRFQQQAVIRACEHVGFSAAAARDRALGIGTGVLKAFRALATQLLRGSSSDEAESVAALLNRIAQKLQSDCRSLIQEEAVLSARLFCLEYLARLPILREQAVAEQAVVIRRKEALAELLRLHRNRAIRDWTEDRWVAFFNRALEEGEEKAMRYEASGEKR